MSIQHGKLVSPGSELTNNILSSATGIESRLATAIFAFGKYVLLLLAPFHLSIDYSYAEISLMHFSDLPVLASLAALILLACGGIYLFRKNNAIGFCILYFIITLSIVSNVVFLIGTVMADRLLYMPSLGLVLAIAFLLNKWAGQNADGKKIFAGNKTAWMAGGLLFLIYSGKTVTRNTVWQNNRSLFEAAVEDAPKSAYVHYLHANTLINDVVSGTVKDSTTINNMYVQALADYKKAIAIKPTDASFYSEAAATFRKMKNQEMAMKYYDMALQRDDKLPQTYNGKGVIYFEQKKYNEAIQQFQQSVKLNAVDATTWRNLGSCYLIMGDSKNALSALQNALKYDPYDAQVLQYIGFAYEDLGDKATANSYFEKAKTAQNRR
jgi:tetratricopeptide (TPR) repeat protein